MKPPRPPRLDQRRAPQFTAELRERARAWIPSWGLVDGERDFGRALLDVAARFSAEVAERLDRAGEKMQRGFLDWLAVRGKAARPARMPVVFKLADGAPAVLAPELVRLQVDANGATVTFETETDVQVVPGTLAMVAGVDLEQDALYLPPLGLSNLEPLAPLPTEWQLKSFASARSRTLQLDPEAGVVPGLLLEVNGRQYLVTTVDNGIATIEPPLDDGLAAGTTLRQVDTFAPFDGAARNRQEHALYLGHLDLLNIEAKGTIEVVGVTGLSEDVKWEYWGKVDPDDEVTWQPLNVERRTPGGVVLSKGKGAVDPLPIDGKNGRWIRAVLPKVESKDGALLETDTIELRVNCAPKPAPCPPTGAPATSAPDAEAMANTTPLVLDNEFFPLGKEPKQFDAFYLGSQEAFSKPGAQVQLCFEVADPTFRALSAVREGLFEDTVLAGVAKDRSLHLFAFQPLAGTVGRFRDREGLQPPAPGYEGIVDPAPVTGLDPEPPWKLPVWTELDPGAIDPRMIGFRVAMSAGDDIWIWYERASGDFATRSGWRKFGSLPPANPPATRPVDALVFLADAGQPLLVGLRQEVMSIRQWNPPDPKWTPVATKDGTKDVALASLVPILEEATGLSTSRTDGMVGVGIDEKLYRVTATGACTDLGLTGVNPKVRPIAVRRATGELVVAVATTTPGEVLTFDSVAGTDITALDAGDTIVGFEAVLGATSLSFLASVRGGVGGGYLASWIPNPAATIEIFRTTIPEQVGKARGAPTHLAGNVVVPGERGDIIRASYDLNRRFSLKADINAGVVVPATLPAFQPYDVVTLDDGPPFDKRLIADIGTPKDSSIFYPIDLPFGAAKSGALYGFRPTPATALKGDVDSTAWTLKLPSTDMTTVQGSIVLVEDTLYRVGQINPGPGTSRLADLDPHPTADISNASYWNGAPVNGRVAPYMRLDAANNQWDASLLDTGTLIFSTAPSPADREKRGQAFVVAGTRPVIVVLTTDWTAGPPPGPATPFVLDAVAAAWSRLLGDSSANPDLSWEYWNGKGWWNLDGISDLTENLKRGGPVQFQIPEDIASSDWSGKTNFWIRARLVGGDYGRETVTVRTKDLGNGVTEQTFERSTGGIRPPLVLKLTISYRICEPVPPTFVLTQDSRSRRDQSDANKTPGAIVEAFVPLALAFGRLSGSQPAAPADDDCPPPPTSSAGTPPRVTPARGRALFVGVTGTLLDGPVNLLLLVEERKHLDQAPMTIEALIADRFVPIVANDITRALGESGLLSMTFSLAPTPRELFGQTLTWLKLSPRSGSPADEWKPMLRGVYLNAVWASATETLTRELLGSSEGAPGLTLTLARPPVLAGTLELRVREPLGEEERTKLRQDDPNRVLNDRDLPGDWVLWKQVTDPDDEEPTERVYALDEATGEIRFGDGQHGMIPPIGTDAIVAFSYQRTEAGKPDSDVVPANTIVSRVPLNLVTPVEGVEAVVSAEQAAGGSPPERAERVVRFGTARLRHRERAVTTRDVEDLALQSSPDIVQARAVARGGGVRLVVVMRGPNPTPSAAEVRELERQLLAAGPLALSGPDALRIRGPRVRRLRVELRLGVETLDDVGSLNQEVRRRLAALFDPATGGPDQDGWPLGIGPTESDVALALIDTPRLQSIIGVELRERVDGRDRPWPATLRPDELAMPADDPIRLEFATVTVVA